MDWQAIEDPEDPWEHVVGRVSRIDEIVPEGSVRPRISVEFDSIEAAEWAVSLPSYPIEDLNSLTRGVRAIRAVTTAARFMSFIGPLEIGAWFLLRMVAKRPTTGMSVRQSPLGQGGFTELQARWIVASQFLFDEERLQMAPPQPGGAPKQLVYLSHDIAAASRFLDELTVDPASATKILQGVGEIARVVVRDVGQASYATFLGRDARPRFYYDVGWPLPFNRRTAPISFFPDPERRPVILSHWDWDHLHAALRYPHLMQSPWIVPVQKQGPGAARIARGLHAAGHLYPLRDTLISTAQLTLASCTGKPEDSNNSGLALEVRLDSGFTVLFTGDADYAHLPPGLRRNVDGLVATHHCARFSGKADSLPRPHPSRNRFIASFGAGNVYKHPHPEAVSAHRRAGWKNLDSTAGEARRPRGDRSFP